MEIPIETLAVQWRAIDWKEIQRKIEDDVLLKIGQDQQALLSNRKQLVEVTKEFKRLEDSEKIHRVPALLKEYQGQIDNYARFFSELESTLGDLLKPFLVLSSPSGFIDLALENKLDLASLERLREDNCSLNSNLTAITGKLERLGTENSLLKAASDKLQSDLAILANELTLSKSDGENSSKMIYSLQEKCSQLESSLARAHQERTETFGNIMQQISSKDTTIDLLKNEVDILTVTLDQARQRCLEEQQEIARLKGSMNSDNSNAEVEEWHQKEVGKLRMELSDREIHHQKVISELKSKLEAISGELARRNDYAELKKRLNILMIEEFGVDQGNDVSLEEMLMQKNRRVESELVRIRLELEKTSKLNASLQEELQKTKADHGALEVTIEQYEQMTRSPHVSPTQSATMDDCSSIAPSESQHPHSDDIITVLTNQRARFQKRNKELELQSQQLTNENEMRKREIERLKAEHGLMSQRVRQLENQIVSKTRHSGKDLEQQSDNKFVGYIRELGRFDQAVNKIARVFFTNRMGRKLTMFYLFILHVTFIILLMRGGPSSIVPGTANSPTN